MTLAASEDALFYFDFCLYSKRVNTISICGYKYMCYDENSACSKYIENFKDGNQRRRQLQRSLYEVVGMSAEKIESNMNKIKYFDTYMELINLFKQGSPLSIMEKRKEIKRQMFCNLELATAMKAHDRSGDNTMLKIYNACYATRSPLLTAIVYELLFKAKYSMKGIYHLMAKYLH